MGIEGIDDEGGEAPGGSSVRIAKSTLAAAGLVSKHYADKRELHAQLGLGACDDTAELQAHDADRGGPA